MAIGRPAQVRGVIFDVDGTLVDSNDAHAQAWVRAMEEAGYHARFEEVRRLIGMGGDKLLPKVLGIDAESAEGKVLSERREHFFRCDHIPVLKAFPGARHLVQLLVERGFRVTIASSAQAQELEKLLAIARVDDLVIAPVSKDHVDKSKPDPDAVQVALEHVGVPSDQVVMIGDTPYDVEAAARAGVATIAFRCGGWSEQDLADAIAIYDDPQHLANEFDRSPLIGRRVA